MKKTQRQLAEILGTSLRAIHSFEQGWRKVPIHVERQMLLFAMLARRANKPGAPCWKIKRCSPAVRESCPAWEFKAGDLCWFINGTICKGKSQRTWPDKMKFCRTCQVFIAAVGSAE